MLLTKKEIAEVLNISVPTVNRFLKKGMPHLKVGKLVRFEQEKVMAWIESQQK